MGPCEVDRFDFFLFHNFKYDLDILISRCITNTINLEMHKHYKSRKIKMIYIFEWEGVFFFKDAYCQ